MTGKGEPCQVCSTSERTSYHFGTTTCMACASFFRRTVAFGIRFLCKSNNNCSISPKARFFCRSCRFDKCVNVGMNKSQVQQKRDLKNAPKYIMESRNLGVHEVVRGYTTTRHAALPSSNSTSSVESTPLSSPVDSTADPSPSEFSIILNTHPDDLLQYYVKQVEMSIVQKQLCLVQNTLLVNSADELRDLSDVLNDLSMESCMNCPGVDILRQEDIEVLLKTFHFANVWLDAVWAFSRHCESICDSTFEDNEPLYQFINQVKSTLGSSLFQLKLNIYEFAALKAFCVWKLGYHDSTIAIKIMAEDQYIGISSALRKYYKESTSMSDLEIAARIAEITLQIVPATTIYQDMIRFYQHKGISI
ncbi:Nuclear Hormone Receptor family [Caenorhabditis elegans]|uniref:Nuclear Hormone Receptor family n=1 Tax=Caenorhabditis elegans TaxID=6239 RepID=O44668_CAEEL|nr:Nuclear Hormone Receptor family [Caenorhabditis elegans]CCD64461.2 Nuclear Hormone Receptor family [Caenorhabditis elegans]|eukprot:NP_503239.2 Nuclear Hormone Receptor family [Caenorhabditis elegans]